MSFRSSLDSFSFRTCFREFNQLRTHKSFRAPHSFSALHSFRRPKNLARHFMRRLFAAPLLLLALASAALAGTVGGTIENGTTGKPAAGVEVILIKLQGGMQPVETTKTDAQGHYEISDPNLGAGPMLLRAVYRGVNYHEPVTPGKDVVNVQVFEPTNKTSAFTVTAHFVVLQPDGSALDANEDYEVSNKTQPPEAYYRPDASFLFPLPNGAQLGDVSAVSATGMPVIQTAVDKGSDKAIVFPFRPGNSGVRIEYKLPYGNNQTNLQFLSRYPTQRFAIFVPPSVQVTGDGMAPAGQEQGFNVYLREDVAANSPVQVAVSGTAPPPQQDGASSGSTSGGGNGSGATSADGSGADNSQNPSVNSRVDTANEAPVANVTAQPARLDSLKWVIVAGFAAIFSLGLFYVWRQQPPVAASPAGTTASGNAPGAAPSAASAAAYRGASAPLSSAHLAHSHPEDLAETYTQPNPERGPAPHSTTAAAAAASTAAPASHAATYPSRSPAPYGTADAAPSAAPSSASTSPAAAFPAAPSGVDSSASYAAPTVAPSAAVPSAGASAAGAARIEAEVDQAVRGSLDELKDKLFRLELRREAGTITDEDYARQREQVQKILRDLVKG